MIVSWQSLPALNEQPPLAQVIVFAHREAPPGFVSPCLAAGETAGVIVEYRLASGLAVEGEKFKRNKISFSEMLSGARVLKEALQVPEPLRVAAGARPEPNAVIGTGQETR